MRRLHSGVWLGVLGCAVLLTGCTVSLPRISPTPTATKTPTLQSTLVQNQPTAWAKTLPAVATVVPQSGTQLAAPTPEPPPIATVVATMPTIARERPVAIDVVADGGEPATINTPTPGLDAGLLPALPNFEEPAAEPGIEHTRESVSDSVLPPSPLDGDLGTAYPLLLTTDRLTLHYTPGSITAAQPDAAAAQVLTALEHLEQLFKRPLPGSFDAYAAGSLFSPPDQALRGRSFSALRRLFFLQDGSGSVWDQQYIIGHELTHLYLWNAVGAPSSVMLSEGAAVYAGAKLVEGEGPMPLRHICLAYARAGALPYMTGDLSYQGHIRDMENYYAAGCFVQYLVEAYGVDAFTQLYPTSDYLSVYGKSLATLGDEWQQQLAVAPDTLVVEPSAFVAAAERIKGSYRELFAAFGNTAAERARYADLDRARTALLEGRNE